MSDFTDTTKIHQTLGDYWYGIYGGEEQVYNYLNSLVEGYKQVDNNLNENIDALSRKDIHVFHKELCMPYKIKLSDYEEWIKEAYLYDGTNTYNGLVNYDATTGRKIWRIKLSDDIVSIGGIKNRVIDPEIDWSGLEIKDHYVYLPEDIFKLEFDTEYEYDDTGKIVDTVLTLWLYDALIDKKELYRDYGYVLGVELESSENYKKIINALFDALVFGPGESILYNLLDGILDGAEYEFIDTDTSFSDFPGLVLSENIVQLDKLGYLFAENNSKSVSLGDETPVRLDLPLSGDKKSVQKFNDVMYSNGVTQNTEVTDECALRELQKVDILAIDSESVSSSVSITGGFRDIQQLIFGR